MLILGIETSCDETAAAVVSDECQILSNIVLSQVDQHRPYGGIVPEIAARSHLTHIDRLVAQALADADIDFNDLDGIAATGGPGLISGVMVGMMTAKAIALVHNLPLIAVNHLEGHALTVRLTDGIKFPYLLLLVSGGHCQLLAIADMADYRCYGGTVDDAIGEAFDKTAILLGLGYPGGPALEAAALKGDPTRFDLPRPMSGRPGCNFSFSGLKTAVRHTVARIDDDKFDTIVAADIAACFQTAIGDVLTDRCDNAITRFRDEFPDGRSLVLAGGVAANRYLRKRLDHVAAEAGFAFHVPPIELCTDNAAMIAWAGIERLQRGLVNDLDFAVRPRWPLDDSFTAMAR
jgi:N6-L-threonylcarbamoyladenine synthase